MSRARREREKSEDKTPSGATRLWKGLDETCWAVCDLPSPSGVGKHIPGIYYLRGTILIRTHHAPKTRTPSDSQYKQGLDKMRCNSGLSNSFSERFFFIGSIAPARKAQNRCLFHPTSKKFVPPQHKLLVFTTTTLELRSNAFPSAGGTCPVLPLWGRNARISTFRRKRSWSGIYSPAARAVGGAGVELIFGDYANPGMIMNRPLPRRAGHSLFFHRM